MQRTTGHRSGEGPVSEQILDASTLLFAAKGFDGTSLQAICDVVGIRKPSLLYHFPSKEILREKVLEQLLSHWKDVLPRLLTAATTGKGRLDSVVEEAVSFFSAHPHRARLLLREMLDRPAAMRASLSAHLRPWIDLSLDYIRQGQRVGSVPEDLDPEAYLVMLIHLVLTATAMLDVSQGLLSGPNGCSQARQVREIKRLARASMFAKTGKPKRQPKNQPRR